MISALFLAEGLAQLGCGIGAGIATIPLHSLRVVPSSLLLLAHS